MAEPSLKNRDATAEEWSDSDFILPAGMVGRESPSGKHKYGNGVDVWDDLDWPDEVWNSGNETVSETQVNALIAAALVGFEGGGGDLHKGRVEDFDDCMETGVYTYLLGGDPSQYDPVLNEPAGHTILMGTLVVSNLEVTNEDTQEVNNTITQMLYGTTATLETEMWVRSYAGVWFDWSSPTTGGTP